MASCSNLGTDMGVSEKKGTLLWGHYDTMLGSPIC